MVFDLFGAGSERRRSLTPGDKAYLLRVSRRKSIFLLVAAEFAGGGKSLISL